MIMRSLVILRNFNPRSREGSDTGVPRLKSAPNDFNPRSREGSDADRADYAGLRHISIRAPARGATYDTKSQ